MTKYREILRLRSLGLSQNDIAASCQVSKKTVNKVLKLANEYNLRWPLEERLTDREIDKIIHPNGKETRKITDRKLPDFDHVKNELLRNGVNKKLLWAEYFEECRLENTKPLMYSQFCHYIPDTLRERHMAQSYGPIQLPCLRRGQLLFGPVRLHRQEGGCP